MNHQINQQQVYDDLSQSLLIIKNKLKAFLKKHQPNDLIIKDCKNSNAEANMNERLHQLMNKYRQVYICSPQLLNITKRFICRVKELLTQSINCISKHQLHLLVKIQRIELFASRCVNKDNCGLAISSLLEIINNVTNQYTSTNSQLINQQHRHTLTNSHDSTPHPNSTTKTEFSQVKMILDQVQTYNKVMDVDQQYFRCKYFDLKQDSYQNTFNQILNRNRYIRNIMNNYQSDHSKFKNKQSHHRYQSEGKITQQKTETKASQPQKGRLTVTDRTRGSAFIHSRSLSKQNLLNSSFQINYQKYLKQQAQMETFRHLYQQKMNDKNHNFAKINNMVLPEPSKNIHIKNTNTKKLQFCKKSHEQQRYRYKYFIRTELKFNNFGKGKTAHSHINSDTPDQK